MNISQNNSIFVISDLHIGNGSSQDAFARTGKGRLLHEFLDHVEREDGQLIIGGDLLELWWFTLEEIQERWSALLDRLLAMNAVYIPGNHDAGVATLAPSQHHAFFDRVQRPFTMTIGDKQFRFMHGHEIDPFDSDRMQRYGQRFGSFKPLFDLKDWICEWTNHGISDVLYGIGEQCLHLGQWLKGHGVPNIHDLCFASVETEQTPEKRSLRTQRMLSRFHADREAENYDVVIAGHTHKAGRFGHWYFNSGCWTKPENHFLKIQPDGHTELFQWHENGAHLSDILM